MGLACLALVMLLGGGGCGDDAASRGSAEATQDAGNDAPEGTPDAEDQPDVDDDEPDGIDEPDLPEDEPDAEPEVCGEDVLGETAPEAPRTLIPPFAREGLVVCPADSDWFAVPVTRGEQLNVEIVDPSGALTLRVWDRRAQGVLAEGQRRGEALVAAWPTDGAGLALVEVDNPGAVSAFYTLNLALGPVDDSDRCARSPEEPNDSAQDAFPLTSPETALDALLCEGDVDWFGATPEPGAVVTARIDFVHGDGDLDLRAWRLDTMEIIDQSDSVADREQVQAGPFDQAVPVAFEVYGFRDASGPYSLRTVDLGPPEATPDLAGSVVYEDLPYGPDGFTGERARRPAANVVVEVVRELDGAVVGRAVADEGGRFNLAFGQHAGQRYRARALAAVEVQGQGAVVYRARVQDRTSARAVYAVATEPFDAGATPADPLELVASADEGVGGAMNIADRVGAAMRFVGRFTDKATPTLTVQWQRGQAFDCGSCYSDDTIRLGGQLEDPDEYDDHIILHELGHHIVHRLSADDSPGGTHRDLQVSPVLAWGEGVAYFFCAMVLEDPQVVDNFLDGVRTIDLEAVTQNGLARDDMQGTDDGTLRGDHREEVVAAILWDALDAESPDEPFDLLEIGVEGHMALLLSWFPDGPAVDVGARGIDLSDWLNDLYCADPELGPALGPVVEDRGYPWTVEDDARCDGKGAAPRPLALTARADGVWLDAALPGVAAPGTVTLRAGKDADEAMASPSEVACAALPCRVAPASTPVVVVTGELGEAWFGASLLSDAAASALRGGAQRTSPSSLGPIRETPSAR